MAEEEQLFSVLKKQEKTKDPAEQNTTDHKQAKRPNKMFNHPSQYRVHNTLFRFWVIKQDMSLKRNKKQAWPRDRRTAPCLPSAHAGVT